MGVSRGDSGEGAALGYEPPFKNSPLEDTNFPSLLWVAQTTDEASTSVSLEAHLERPIMSAHGGVKCSRAQVSDL